MPLVNIFVVVLLVAANGFFVACEFSLVAVRPTRLQQLKEAGDSRAAVVAHLLKDLDRILSGVQVGITISSLALGWLGEVTLAGMLEPLLRSLEVPWAAAVAHTVAITVAFLAISSMHVVLGELVPKSMALQRAEKVALLIARPMAVFMIAFGPLIGLFDSASNVILRAMGYRGTVGHALVRSAEELRLLLQQVHQHGVVAPQQARMLEGALALSEVEVRQVMVPRRDMVCLPANASLLHVLEVVRTRRRSRYPVFDASPEQVIGAVHAKDLFRHLEERLQRAERGESLPPFDLRLFARECLFVPETKPLAELIEVFRRKRVHLAMVVDEFGSVQGMVTLADIVEPIVGEVRDEYEAVPVPAAASGGEIVLDARTSLHDLEQQHRIELPTGPGFETLAGFILNRLGYIPTGGESFLHDGLRFTVLEMEGRRVARVRIERLAEPARGEVDSVDPAPP
ncbi:MAG: HlyC/CorC family transporter [Acidobacteria bacterium]|nr:HlyC/CorC family transporter [Acidobacteriota bacterium]